MASNSTLSVQPTNPVALIHGARDSRRLHVSLAVLFATLCLSLAPRANAQNVQYDDKALDLGLRNAVRVDPTTRGLNFEIPLGSYHGRAGLNVPVTLSYTSKVWNVEFEGYNAGAPPQQGGMQPFTIVVARYAKHSVAGWTSSIGMPIVEDAPNHQHLYNQIGEPKIGNVCLLQCWTVNRLTIWMPDGSGHELRASDQPRLVGQDPVPDNFYSVDESRMRYQVSTGTLFLPDGSRYLLNSSQYIDPNGNKLTYSNGAWTDTLGRQVANPLPYNPGSAPAVGDQNVSLPGVGGTSINYVLKWRNLSDVLTTPQSLRYVGSTGCPPEISGPYSPALFGWDSGTRTCIGNASVLFNPVVLHQVVLPNGQAYTFTYNNYGEIDKVVLPTGGYERYEYGLVSSITFTTSVYAQGNRGVTSRIISPSGLGTDEALWTYSGGFGTATIVGPAPESKRTELSFWTDQNGSWGYSPNAARGGRVYDERTYNVAGQMLHRKMTDWAMTGSAGGTLSGTELANRHARPVREVEFVLDTGGSALAKTTTYTYDTTYQFTVGVELSSVSEYEFVSVDQTTAQTIAIASLNSIPNGTLLRRTTTNYLTSDQNYRDRHFLGLPTSLSVYDGSDVLMSQTTYSYDEAGYPLISVGSPPYTGWIDPGTTVRGNVTTVALWLNTSGTFLQTHAQYDQFGNVRNNWDAKQNLTQTDYSSAFAFAYPTQITTADPDGGGPAVALVTTTEYDLTTGRATATVDGNNQRTTFAYNDPLNRLKQVVHATTDTVAKTQTAYTYDDTNRTITVTTDQSSFDDNVIRNQSLFDGLGRAVEHRQYETATDYIAVKTEYDVLGRVYRSSNPYRPGEAILWTTTEYDLFSRVTAVTTPDNSFVSTIYAGNSVTVTDQAGKRRKSVTDALGRWSDVWEDPQPQNPSGLNYQTTYTYDALNNLIKVTQGSQQRFFMYDSLKRLIRSRNPEQNTLPSLNLSDPISGNSAWTIGYEYDSNGNLTKKTDARGVESTYSYDALNRNTKIDYSDTSSINPDVTRVYDGAVNGKGRLWKSYAGGTETDGSNVERTVSDSYDALGRPLVLNQSFKLNNEWKPAYQTTRVYNRAGAVTSQIYPSGHSVNYNYDNAGRLANTDPNNLAFTGNLGDGVLRTYSRDISYASTGQMKQEEFGTTTAIYNKLFYNWRQQLAEILVSTTGGDASYNRGRIINAYSLQCSGAGCNATDNNGNLRKQQVDIPTNEQASSYVSWYQQYEYDALNRLQSVLEIAGGAQQWRQWFGYDRWANRTIDSTQDPGDPNPRTYGTGINNKAFEKEDATNRLYAPGDLALPDNQRQIRYDAAGNQTKDIYTGYGTATFDANNHITTINDKDGGTANYTYNADGQRTRRKIGSQETWQIYGMEGELLAEYPQSGDSNAPQKEYGYRNGQLLVVADANGIPIVPEFSDDFNDNSLNTMNWSVLDSNSPAVVSEQNQQLQITLAASTATYNGVVSVGTYSMEGKMVQVEVPQAVSQAGWVENALMIQKNSTNYFLINVGVTSLLFRSMVNGANDQSIITYNPASHRFWRIRHDQTTSTIAFETSGNGTGWTTQKSVNVGFSLTGLKFQMHAGAYGTGNASPGAAKYDNFKLVSSQASYSTLSVSNSGFETPNIGAGVWQYSPSGGSWTFASGAGLSGNGSAFTSGNPSTPEGSQVAFLQGSEATITQSVSGFQSGVSYSIIFMAAQRGNCCNAGGQDFRVYVDNTLLGTFHPTGTSYLDYDTPAFTVSAGTHTIKFAALNSLGGDHTAFIDNVRLVGSTNNGVGTQWLVSDHLGTPRMVIDQTGNLANVKRHDYLPFGEEIFSGVGLRNQSPLGYTSADSVRQQFTSKERDIETGLDYFLARYYSSSQGRFTSPDEFKNGPYEVGLLGSGHPEKQALVYADITNPQSLNKYQYTFNNPLRYVDPDGQNPQDGHELRLRRDEKALLERKMTPEEFMDRRRAEGVGAIVGLATLATLRGGPPVAIAIWHWATRNPDKVHQLSVELSQASTGSPISAPSGLTVSAATRLTADEISTGVRLAEQTGLRLREGLHIGEEFVSAAGKTYDAMGVAASYTAQNWGNGSKFFASILHHVNKSIDYVAIDLSGASKAQIQAIEKYVSGLTKQQQAKIIYVK